MKKVFIDLTVRLIVEVTKNVDIEEIIQDVIQEMDYDFASQTKGATIINTEINDQEIVKVE